MTLNIYSDKALHQELERRAARRRAKLQETVEVPLETIAQVVATLGNIGGLEIQRGYDEAHPSYLVRRVFDSADDVQKFVSKFYDAWNVKIRDNYPIKD